MRGTPLEIGGKHRIYRYGPDETSGLLPHLFQFTAEHRGEGRALQAELSEFEDELRGSLEEVWVKIENDGRQVVDSWAARMEEREKKQAINPIDKVPKPEFPRGSDWRVNLFDL